MKLSLYLHQNIIDTLKCFGELNDVVNKLIEESMALEELYEDKLPCAPSRDGSKRINVRIVDELYQELGYIKVRPLIYWFVENEIYDQLGWQMVNKYGEERRNKVLKKFDNAIESLESLNKVCEKFQDFIDALKSERSNYETQ